MRIAAVLECEEAIGGGFVQAVNSIVRMAEVCQKARLLCLQRQRGETGGCM